MRIIIETPSGKTLQQHLTKCFGKLSKEELTQEKAKEIAMTIQTVMKRCAVVFKTDDGEFINGVML